MNAKSAPFRLVILLVIPLVFLLACSKKEVPVIPPSDSHTEKPVPLPDNPAPKEDLRCAGVVYSTHTVTITKGGMKPENRYRAFSPAALQIKRCDKVVWKNEEEAFSYHTATADDLDQRKDFDTLAIMVNTQSRPIQFKEAGEYPYHCTPHSEMMRGKIGVTP